MRTALAYLTMLVSTLIYGSQVLVAALFGLRPRPDGQLEAAPRRFSRNVLWVSGVKVRVSGSEHAAPGEPRVFVANHVSWYDVFTLATILPRYRFVAKKELRKLPIFGPATALVAGVFIDRQNRKAAFEAYREAVDAMKTGINVVVFPEGTRGHTYSLRPFKKGPFVLAIAAQAPIVPCVLHGTRDVAPKGRWAVHAGDVEVSILEPIPTAGMTYENRDELMRTVWSRMADELETRWGERSDRAVLSTQATSAA
ncbi:MAG: lysophospholipid acyltransferase family protein [Gemmatimonadaceae bacterium]